MKQYFWHTLQFDFGIYRGIGVRCKCGLTKGWYLCTCSFVSLQVASTKGNDKVGTWLNQIINHFWHCSSVASEYEDTTQALAAMKVDIQQTNSMHHVYHTIQLEITVSLPADIHL